MTPTRLCGTTVCSKVATKLPFHLWLLTVARKLVVSLTSDGDRVPGAVAGCLQEERDIALALRMHILPLRLVSFNLRLVPEVLLHR